MRSLVLENLLKAELGKLTFKKKRKGELANKVRRYANHFTEV